MIAHQQARITPELGAGTLLPITLRRPANARVAPLPPFLPPITAPVSTGITLVNADGMTMGKVQPINATGAVGDAQFVQLADATLAIYDKTAGALQLGPFPTAALFDGPSAGTAMQACGAGASGSASVQFDHLAKRWIVAFLSSHRGPSGSAIPTYCLAVSASADASGSYRRYLVPIQGPSGPTLIVDDPRLAVWADAFYLTFALFDATGNYQGPRACGIDRVALLAGRDAQVRCHDLGPAYGPLSPATMDGYAIAPDGNHANTLLSLDVAADGTGQQLFAWRFSFSRNAFSQAQSIPVAPFRAACTQALDGACVDQPMPGSPLAAMGERLMPRLAYRYNDGIGSLVATHAVQAGDRVGLRWYELRDPEGALQVYQQGTHAPDHNSRWMGSIGIDKAGNIALGYNVAGKDVPPAIRYTGRQRSDPHGRMQGEAFIIDGRGVQTGPAGRPALHGALTLDPIDGCTFWYTQRYGPATGSVAWRTRIASFRFENCR